LNITSTPPVTSLNLVGNLVDSIEKGWLKGGEQVDTLSLMQNRLSTFSLSAVAGLDHLTVVDVRFNQIERVGRGEIDCSHAPKLQQVRMQGNPFSYVHIKAVVNCSKMTVLEYDSIKCLNDTSVTTVFVGANDTIPIQACECRAGFQCVDRHVVEW
jgi:Leucine-rich repeat (LRR) protein